MLGFSEGLKHASSSSATALDRGLWMRMRGTAAGREVGMATAKDGAGGKVGMARTARMKDGMATAVGIQVGTTKIGATVPN